LRLFFATDRGADRPLSEERSRAEKEESKRSMYQTRFRFPNRHGGNRKHNWAIKQKRRGNLCPVPHRPRCEVEERFPMHVTMRLEEGLENLRTPRS